MTMQTKDTDLIKDIKADIDYVNEAIKDTDTQISNLLSDSDRNNPFFESLLLSAIQTKSQLSETKGKYYAMITFYNTN